LIIVTSELKEETMTPFDLPSLRDERKRGIFRHTSQGLIKIFSSVYRTNTWDDDLLLGQCFRIIAVRTYWRDLTLQASKNNIHRRRDIEFKTSGSSTNPWRCRCCLRCQDLTVEGWRTLARM